MYIDKQIAVFDFNNIDMYAVDGMIKYCIKLAIKCNLFKNIHKCELVCGKFTLGTYFFI